MSQSIDRDFKIHTLRQEIKQKEAEITELNVQKENEIHQQEQARRQSLLSEYQKLHDTPPVQIIAALETAIESNEPIIEISDMPLDHELAFFRSFFPSCTIEPFQAFSDCYLIIKRKQW